MTFINTKVSYKLHDVNNRIVTIIGTHDIHFSINDHKFNHTFVVYGSDNGEILLGYDFLKAFKIGIFPNVGLIWESQPIFRLGDTQDLMFPIKLITDVTLSPFAQQVVEVQADLGQREDLLPLWVDRHVIAHSEDLQPLLSLSKLQIFFQYVQLSKKITV